MGTSDQGNMSRITEVLRGMRERYCILHGWSSFTESSSSDLDMVVAPEDVHSLENTLRYSQEVEIVQLLQYETSCFYLVLVPQNKPRNRFMAVDIATDYRRDGCILLTAENLLAGRLQWNNLWVASPQVEFEYLLVKKVMKGELPDHKKNRLGELLDELGEEADSIIARLFGKKLKSSIVSWICGEDRNNRNINLPRFKRRIIWQKISRDPLNPFRYWIPELGRFWRRWRYPTGFFVAFLGPDGAGKSSLIGELATRFRGVFRKSAIFHLRPRILGARTVHTPSTTPHAESPYSQVVSVMKLLYYMADYLLGYWLQVRPALSRSTLVLFDRYYYDILVDSRRYRYGGPRKLLQWAQRRIPRPDLTLILDVPEDSLLQRKRELPPVEMRRQRASYRRLANSFSSCRLVDANLSKREVAEQATGVVLDAMRKRYLRRRHIWFGKKQGERNIRP